MERNTSRKNRSYRTAKLSEEAEAKLRKSLKINEMGNILREDLKEKPYKLCAWMLSSLALASVMAGTLALKMRSEDVKKRFKHAAEKPLNVKFFESVLVENPVTGEFDVCSKSLFKRQKDALFFNLNYLAEYGLDKLPRKKIVQCAQRLHARMTRNPMPATFNERSQRSSRIKGAIFALASLGTLEPSDMAAHLYGREQEMFLQEYATLEV